MKLLVTGCRGQVGVELCERLTREGLQHWATDVDSLDICNEMAVSRFIDENRPDIIINAAAYTAVDRAEQDRDAAHLVNAHGPLNLARAAERFAALLLHISTDYVFSGEHPEPYVETDEPSPCSVYGRTKLTGEQAVTQNCQRHIIMRTSWVFAGHGKNFVKTMLRLGRERDELGIVSDQFGGPTFAGDIAEALIKMGKALHSGTSQAYGIYHFSGEPQISWFDFASVIFDEATRQGLLSRAPKLVPLTTNQYPTAAKRPLNSRLAMDKIRGEFEIEPSDWMRALGNLEPYTSKA